MGKLPMLHQNSIYQKGYMDGYNMAVFENNNVVRLYRDPLINLVLRSHEIFAEIKAAIQYLRGDSRAAKLQELRIRFNENSTEIDNHFLVSQRSGYFANIASTRDNFKTFVSKTNDMLGDAIANPDKVVKITLEHGFTFPQTKTTGRPDDPVNAYIAEQAIALNPDGKRAYEVVGREMIHDLSRLKNRSYVKETALSRLIYHRDQECNLRDWLKTDIVKSYRKKKKEVE